MSDYKLVPVEPTAEMMATGGIEMGARDEDARTVWKAMIAAAPAVQGEPVGWVNSDELDNMLDDRTATLFPVRTGFHGKPVYATPQPVEHRPCPESIREGAPYDDPAFSALCREHEVWATAAAAQCAVFWEAGKRVAEQQPAPDVAGLVEALRRARRTAMEQSIKARIPECAEFAGIAQDLDFVVAALEQEGEP